MNEILRPDIMMPTCEQWDRPAPQVIVDGYRIASRIVMPLNADIDMLPVYLDQRKKKNTKLNPGNISGRHSMMISSGQRVSFGSYFNAFPAGYWRRWTVVRSLRLVINTSGCGSVIVYRSNARGAEQRVAINHLDAGSHQSVFDLPLTGFADGGFYWFDLVAGKETLTLESAEWWVPTCDRTIGSLTLATTTYNKPDYVVKNLTELADQSDILSVVDRILIVDQGDDKVQDYPGFDQAADALGDKLEIINQPNLGGSGGFARGQYETCMRGESDYVVLVDDDVNLEAESLTRMNAFADLCARPTIVGGHMFDLHKRTSLHAYGEVVNPNSFMWQPAVVSGVPRQGHNFAKAGLRDTAWLHARMDVDYNGWWFELIPTSIIKEIGLSLPVFIKWDDVEYSLRAREHGYPTVSLPGAALWHISWLDKDDIIGWQAYFHERNRLITALLYSGRPRGGEALNRSIFHDLRHIVSMQYYTIAGRLMAQRDLLAGPEYLHKILEERNAEVRSMAKEFSDSQVKAEFEDFPPFAGNAPHRSGYEDVSKVKRIRAMRKAGVAVLRQLLPTAAGSQTNPQGQIAHKDNKWWNVARWDSVLVTNAEGSGISWYKRQPEKARKYMAESINLHLRLAREWDKLAARYREALPQITSFEAWEKTFGITTEAKRASEKE